ncbi:DesA Fatty acid desaturase [Acidimicrobiia bacterium]
MTAETMSGSRDERRIALRSERTFAAPYWSGFEPRVVIEFAIAAIVWVGVIVAGVSGIISLWVGLIINTVVASTFYMPMHEAAHGNIWGRNTTGVWGQDLIGMLCAIPLCFSYKAHRSSHMRHHAHTNDPERDPDHFTAGSLITLPGLWFSQVVLATFLPVFAFLPGSRRLLPNRLKRSMRADEGNRQAGLRQLKFWAISTLILVLAFATGFGWPALLLWYIPARMQALWLLFVFAWYPHHPANKVGRYVDTRIAVFPGSRFLIRGHDHHAVHHLFPRVPHYRLRALWSDVAVDMVPKGVRSEGRAVATTGPITW